MNDIKVKMMQNAIAVMQGIPAPYPELTAEAAQERARQDRQTYLYGYGISFQDDREFKAFQEGRLIF